jgi:thiol-disulfide isomerase/thioredoxin
VNRFRSASGRTGAWLLAAVLLLIGAAGVSIGTVVLRGGGRPAPSPAKPHAAPEFAGIEAWINSAPRTVASLRGTVVLVDFWTFSCINCVRTLPALRAWYERYKAAGFEIVGVHAPEFNFEKVAANVRDATKRLRVTWPVALDNQMATWDAFDNHYWPHVFLIDRDGVIRYDHIGEGNDTETETQIRNLLARPGTSLPPPVFPAEPSFSSQMTPEIYAGYERGEQQGTIANEEGYHRDQALRYRAPANATLDSAVPDGRIFLGGTWRARPEYLEAVRNARVYLPFFAKNVYFVAAAADSARVALRLDGAPLGAAAGDDARESGLTVSRSDLFWLVKLPRDGRHVLEIDAEPGFRLYTFTFG